ncbi:hypothetical protein NXS19_014397 [Fusarium pseudograminearum]|nr:hypothetical protein NXS19_014397 [Fusarium pseudograminearum]
MRAHIRHRLDTRILQIRKPIYLRSRPTMESDTPAMKAPIQLDFAKNPQNKVWSVNNDPKKLDEVYDRLLGQGGSKLLPEEVKWLAVTHKSFDQGRRGFNDRLALLGRMTLIMETTKTIVAKDPMSQPKRTNTTASHSHIQA